MSFLINGDSFNLRMFTEDLSNLSNNIGSSKREEDLSQLVGTLSPPEFHTSCIMRTSDTKLQIFVYGGTLL